MNEKNNIYVGMRYVPVFADNWDSANEYESLTMVTVNGNTYISKGPVPANTEITNTTYWAQMYAASSEVAALQTQVNALQSTVDELGNGSGGIWHSAEEYGIKPDGTDITPLLSTLPSNVSNLAFPAGLYTMSAAASLIGVYNIYFAPGCSFSNTLTLYPTTVWNPPANVACSGARFVYNPNGASLTQPLWVFGGTIGQLSCKEGQLSRLFGCSISQLTMENSANLYAYGCTFTFSTKVTPAGNVCAYSCANVSIDCDIAENCDFNNTSNPTIQQCRDSNITFAVVNTAKNCTGSPATPPPTILDSQITIPNVDSLPIRCENSTLILNFASGSKTFSSNVSWFNVSLTTPVSVSPPSDAWTNLTFAGPRTSLINVTVGSSPARNVLFTLGSTGQGYIIGGLRYSAVGNWQHLQDSSTPVSSDPQYSIGWGVCTSADDISTPGRFETGSGNMYGLRLFKNNTPITTTDNETWELTSLVTMGPNNVSLPLIITYTSLTSSIGEYTLNKGTQFNPYRGFNLYASFSKGSDTLWFMVPHTPSNGNTAGFISLPIRGPLLFKNSLYPSAQVPTGTLLIVANTDGGANFYAWDINGVPIQVTDITFTTGPTSGISPAVTYDTSTRLHGLASWPSASIYPIPTICTFKYPDQLSNATYTTQPFWSYVMQS